MGVIHHVCGEYELACGSCNHGPLLNEEPDDYLSKSDKCTEAFDEVVLDKNFLKSLSHYVQSRHTGCFNVSTVCYSNKPQNELRLSMIILLQGRV